jgi:hypothetical protein
VQVRRKNLNGVREMRLAGVDWIHLAQDRDWWQAHMNIVMNLQVP